VTGVVNERVGTLPLAGCDKWQTRSAHGIDIIQAAACLTKTRKPQIMTMAEHCFSFPIHKTVLRVLAALAFLLILSTSATAQSDTLADADAAFRTARELAFAGKRAEGRALAQRIVARYPNYLDIIRSSGARSHGMPSMIQRAVSLAL
jgi:hypothetical protein